jgi:murein DD-endopeptidase MepM/ murein hydrolase activator NlpD
MSLILPEETQVISPTLRQNLSPGMSLLELAVMSDVNPWEFLIQNELINGAAALPGDILQVNSAGLTDQTQSVPSALPEEISLVEITPEISQQGKATAIQIHATRPMTATATFQGHAIQFFPDEDNHLAALQGIHAMAEPGLYPLNLQFQSEGDPPFAYSQMIRLQAVDYPFDQPLVVDPTTIDPAVTRPEDAQWIQLATPITPERYWTGTFQLPSALPADYCLSSGDCWTSRFGNRRSYNGSEYAFFHTGLDIAGKVGDDVLAAAPGVVVFAGPLTVRGNATMIDHGQGVYTGYMHQSEILVRPGERVQAGQLIGRVGATGRVEGPHLHWEVWVGGTQVDPLDWLVQDYP